MATKQYPLIVICGPTAVGKTSLSIKIAEKFHGEIISADSRQFFKEMAIGTAKPTPEEMGTVPHHFVDYLSISEPYTAGKFETDALQCIEEIHARGNTPMMAGGSGLYVKAVLEGLDELPSNPALRAKLNDTFQKEGLTPLLERLERIDPEYYSAVDKHNQMRVMRAIEVVETSGKSMAELQVGNSKVRPFVPIIIGLEMEREKLYERINLRVDQMVAQGLVEEVRGLLSHRDTQAMQTVGYREFLAYFDEKSDLKTAIDLVKRNTRRYAKRQLTWLRSMEGITWFEPQNESQIFEHIERKMVEIRG